MMRLLCIGILLLASCNRSVRVVIEPDGYCVVYRDGREVAARFTSGIVFSEGEIGEEEQSHNAQLKKGTNR